MALGQEDLGKRIRLAREEADLTQPQLAQRIGLKHPQSISNYERGLTDVPPKRLARIAVETRKPMSYFLGEDPAPTVAGGGEDEAARWDRVDGRLARIEEAVELLLAASGAPPPGRAANGH